MQEQILFTSEQLRNTHRIIGHIHAVGCPHQLIQTEFMPDVVQFFSFGQLQSALQFMETLLQLLRYINPLLRRMLPAAQRKLILFQVNIRYLRNNINLFHFLKITPHKDMILVNR